ncbi:hypothetical protein K1719_032776 [Acacia pycnantha]|nr:hypothetical protein K1719_032776 [Acacia pycnantha]
MKDQWFQIAEVLFRLGTLGANTKVVAIHRNASYGVMAQARIQSFRVYMRAEEKRRGNANVKYAWYGTSARKRYERLFHTVFVMAVKLKHKGHFGCGLSLS